VVPNPDGLKGGMTGSLQAGLRAADHACTAVLVLLADQPMIGPATINAVVAAHAADGHQLVAAAHRGLQGHPVLFAKAYFDELLALAPDGAPRGVLARHANEVRLVEAGSAVVLADLDTPEAYARWAREFKTAV